MISTPPISLAAVSAPLAAASKKPLPSDLTTSAIFMSSAFAAPEIMTAVTAAVASSFFQIAIELPPFRAAMISDAVSGRQRRLLRFSFPFLRGSAGDDQRHAGGLEHLRLAVGDAVVGDHRRDAGQSAQDQA